MSSEKEREASDLARLWEQALAKYAETTGKDLAMLPRFKSVSDLVEDSEIKTNMFKKWRNPEDKVDKLRSALGKTTEVLGKLVEIAGSAANGAFPPSEAIATAFNWILKASKDVSADYDKIMDFFDEMNTFLERLQIIEGKIPTVPAYQSHLMRVFSSMLHIAGIATVYIKKGRFRKWVKNFWQMGEDPELAGSYTTMEKELRRLESATGMVTYTNTEEIKTTTSHINITTTQVLDDTTTIKSITTDLQTSTQRIEETTASIDGSIQRVDTKMDSIIVGVTDIKSEVKSEIKTGFKDIMKSFEEQLKKNLQMSQTKPGGAKAKAGPAPPKDPSMKKVAAYGQVRKIFGNFELDGDYKEKRLGEKFVKGTGDWLLGTDEYQKWVEKDSENPFLWIHGGPGVGKSHISYAIVQDLKDRLQEDNTEKGKSSVAYFFYHVNQPDLRNTCNAVSSAILQVAAHDGKFCEQVVEDLAAYQEKNRYANPLSPMNINDAEKYWDLLFLNNPRYKAGSPHHLYWVVDGLDECAILHRPALWAMWKKLKESKANIHIVFTSSLALEKILAEFEPITIEVTRENIVADMRAVAESRIKKNYSQLRKFRPQIRKYVIEKVLEKADSILYVEFMLRRLNLIGRETAVIKDISSNLPDNLPATYLLFLEEIRRRKTPEEFEALKKLFAWIAFFLRPAPITLAEADELLLILGHGTSVGLEEEIQGKLGNILEFSNENLELDDDAEEPKALITVKTLQRRTTELLIKSPTKDDDGQPIIEESSTEFSVEKLLEETEPKDSVLQFRESSLRKTFLAIAVDKKDLRLAPATAQSTIFQMCVNIMCGIYERQGKKISESLKKYAANYWMSHFHAIDHEDVSPATAVANAEAIKLVLEDTNDAAKFYEDYNADVFFPSVHRLLEGYDDIKDEEGNLVGLKFKFYDKMISLANVLLNEHKDKLTPELAQFCESARLEPQKLMVTMAKSHVKHWLDKVTDPDNVQRTVQFWFALTAICMTDQLGYWIAKTHVMDRLSKDVIKDMAHSFDDSLLEGTVQRISLVALLRACSFIEEASEELKLAVDTAKTPFEKFFVGFTAARIDDHIKSSAKQTKKQQKETRKAVYADILAAFEHRPSKEEEEKLTADERAVIRSALVSRGSNEMELKLYKEAIEHYDEARTLDPLTLASPIIHDEIMFCLFRQKKWAEMISHFEKWNFWEQIGWLTYDSDAYDEWDVPEVFCQAAKKAGRTDFYVKIMEGLIEYLDKQKSSAWVRKALAWAYTYVLDNPKKAREQLYYIISHPDQCYDMRSSQEDLLLLNDARNALSEIIYFEFLATPNPKRKLELLAELRTLHNKKRTGIFEDINNNESSTAIFLANMVRQMGPITEFEEIVNDAFNACVAALTDEEGHNDYASLRMLGKVLASIEGLEEEAMIALSSQFSITDPDVKHDIGNDEGDEDEDVPAEEGEGGKDGGEGDGEDGDDDEDEDEEDKEDEDGSEDGDASDDDKLNDSGWEDESVEDVEPCTVEGCTDPKKCTHLEEEDYEEDLSAAWVGCNGECSTSWTSFKDGDIYYCLVCLDTDLCHACYRRRLRGTRKGEWNFWVNYCGENHAYVHLPVPGWKGIKDGVMTIDEEKINFKEWLKELKEKKWPMAWENFYLRGTGVDSINC